jgi:Ca2+-binding EF-hand superfamily protein
VSKAGISFVKSLLHPDYKTRIHSHEALEVPWLSDGTVLTSQTAVLKSAKSFHAVASMRRNSEASDMQKTGMVALVFGINSKAATDLRNVFQSFDSDGSGMLSRQEFERALHEISPDLSSQDINHLFDIVDMDKNKQISYSEFLAATLDPNEVDIEELSKAFKLLDEDGNGYITRDELRKV